MTGESIARGTLLGEVDVAIGLTGPVGLMMANLFGLAGVKVAVLECEQGIRGDRFDADPPPGYHLMDREGLYQWWPDLTDPRLTPMPALERAQWRSTTRQARNACLP